MVSFSLVWLARQPAASGRSYEIIPENSTALVQRPEHLDCIQRTGRTDSEFDILAALPVRPAG